MAETNTILEMEGIFKKRYASKVKYAYPNGIRVTKDIPFDSSKAPGADFNQPVVLQHENGFTLAATKACKSQVTWEQRRVDLGINLTDLGIILEFPVLPPTESGLILFDSDIR